MKTTNDIPTQIYNKTWQGDFWGTEGALSLAEGFYTIPAQAGALSSTYYAASGNAAARAGRIKGFQGLKWRIMAALLLYRAWLASNRFERALGADRMSPDELDVRATILRRIGFKSRALTLLDIALLRDLKPDTEMLLLVGKAEILMGRGKAKLAGECFAKAYRLSRKVKPTTLVRFCRARARGALETGWKGMAKQDLLSAKQIAITHGLGDQLEKIQVLLDDLADVDPSVIRWDFVFPLEG